MSGHTWRVIEADNFDRDTVNDRVIADGLTIQEAYALAREKNAVASLDGPGLWFYRAVPADYKLHRWEP